MKASLLLPDDEPGLSGKPRQQPAKILESQRDAALRRREIEPRTMQKNRAAARFAARMDIVVEHDQEIVEMVPPP